MAILLTATVNGLGLCVAALWGLQERRFSVIFDAICSAARSVTVALVCCFLSVHRHQRPDLGVAFI